MTQLVELSNGKFAIRRRRFLLSWEWLSTKEDYWWGSCHKDNYCLFNTEEAARKRLYVAMTNVKRILPVSNDGSSS